MGDTNDELLKALEGGDPKARLELAKAASDFIKASMEPRYESYCVRRMFNAPIDIPEPWKTRFAERYNKALEGRKEMDKYGVKQEEDTDKTASDKNVCPKCGEKLDKDKHDKWCPSCGTEPWEDKNGEG